MSYYATADASGAITGFYCDAIHKTIPPGAIEITDDQWADAVTNQGKWIVQGGALVQNPAWPPKVITPPARPDLNGLLAWARKNVKDPLQLARILRSDYGALMLEAARAGDWEGAREYYGLLKADMAGASAASYTPATADTLAALAAQFAAFNLPITP